MGGADPPPSPLDPRAWRNLSAAALANRKRAAAGLKGANLHKQMAAGLAPMLAATPAPAPTPSEPRNPLGAPSPSAGFDQLEPFATSASSPGHGPKLVHLTRTAVSPSGPATLAMLTVQGDFTASTLPAQSAPLQQELPASTLSINVFPTADVENLKKAAGVPVGQPLPRTPAAPLLVASPQVQTAVLPANASPTGPAVQGPAAPPAQLSAVAAAGGAAAARVNTVAVAGPPSQPAPVSASPRAPVHNSDGSMVSAPKCRPCLCLSWISVCVLTLSPSRVPSQTAIPLSAKRITLVSATVK